MRKGDHVRRKDCAKFENGRLVTQVRWDSHGMIRVEGDYTMYHHKELVVIPKEGDKTLFDLMEENREVQNEILEKLEELKQLIGHK